MAEEPTFEEAFHKMQQARQNDIVHITNWMRDADIVNEETYPESKFKRLFDGLDTAKIELHKFYEILGRVAEERKTSLEALKNKLVSGPNKYYKAMKDGYAAFSKSLKKVVTNDKNDEEIDTADVITGNVLRKSASKLDDSDDNKNVKENTPHNVRISSVENVQIIESMSSRRNESLSQIESTERCCESLEKVSADVPEIDAVPVNKRK